MTKTNRQKLLGFAKSNNLAITGSEAGGLIMVIDNQVRWQDAWTCNARTWNELYEFIRATCHAAYDGKPYPWEAAREAAGCPNPSVHVKAA